MPDIFKIFGMTINGPPNPQKKSIASTVAPRRRVVMKVAVIGHTLFVAFMADRLCIQLCRWVKLRDRK